MSISKGCCAVCSKTSEDLAVIGSQLLKCSKCKATVYCGKDCQRTDWQEHKRYCGKWTYTRLKKAELENRFHADARGSAVFQRALQAAPKDDQPYELMTAMAAEEFCKVLRDDMLPTCPEEEHIWGLWGEPSSPGYQRVLLAYQKAFKFGDLTATKLMEALCARPHASKALTDLLQNTKIVCTETDSHDNNMWIVDRFRQYVDGVVINSEFDKWPVRPGGAGTSGAAGASSSGAAAAAGGASSSAT